MFSLLLLFLCLTNALGPECRWIADDPVCHAVCTPICLPTKCSFQCRNNVPPPRCFAPDCRTRCVDAENSSPMDSCPACETVCEPLECVPNQNGNCEIVCEATECSWLCEKPTYCQPPRFELTCEKPACEFEAKAATLSMCWTAILSLYFAVY